MSMPQVAGQTADSRRALGRGAGKRLTFTPMSNLAKIVGVVFFLLFIAYVVYSSTHLDEHSCEVCMVFNGLTNCGTATGVTELEAMNSAVTVACANISAGVTEGIACSNTPPKSVNCSRK